MAQLLTTQHAAEQGSLHRRAQVFLGAKFQGAGGIQQAAGLGGFLLPHGDVARIRRRDQFGGQLAAQGGARRLSQAEPDLVKFQQADGALETVNGWGGLFVRRSHGRNYSTGANHGLASQSDFTMRTEMRQFKKLSPVLL